MTDDHQWTKETILKKVIEMVIDRFGEDDKKITAATEFVGDLNADSLDIIEILTRIEKVFEIPIIEHYTVRIISVGQTADSIWHYLDTGTWPEPPAPTTNDTTVAPPASAS